MRRTLDDRARETLGKNLRECREHHQWTQIAAAKRIGIRRSLLNLWENGRQAPGAEGLLLMAITYRVSVDQMLSGVDERYDELIEGRLPLDAQRHYRAKVEAFIRRTTVAMQLATDAAVLAPRREGPAEGKAAGAEKSSRVRVRRKPGK